MGCSYIDLEKTWPGFFNFHQGSKDFKFETLSSPKDPQPKSLIFANDPKILKLDSLAANTAVVFSEQLLKDQDLKIPQNISVISCKAPTLGMAMTAKRFFPVTKNKVPFEGHRIHPSAIIAGSAKISKTCLIGPNSVIGENVSIGENTIIGGLTYLETDVKIGDNTHIHPQVFLGHGTQIGNFCEVQPKTSIGTEGFGYTQNDNHQHIRITHYGNVIIDDDVHIGAGVLIARGTFGNTHFGQGTKVDNYCHFAHNITIGKGCLITAGLICAGSVDIGDFSVFGGRTTIAGHLNIPAGCQIAGLSAIQKSVAKPGKYGGYPLQELGPYLKTLMTLPHLPKIRKAISRLDKQFEKMNNK